MRTYNGMAMGRDAKQLRKSGVDFIPPRKIADKRAIENHRQQQLAKMLDFYNNPHNLENEISFFD